MSIPKDMIPGTIHQTNKNGKLKIMIYTDNLNVTVKFIDTGCVVSTSSGRIRRGQAKDPLNPSVCNIGFIGIGKYSSTIDGKSTASYEVWSSMIRRCYSTKSQEKHPTYKGCSVCNEWHNFQNFSEWFEFNYSAGLHIDKDIKIKGNKIYSPETCIFVTQSINTVHARAKEYILNNPSGEIVHIYNLKKFCRENNLDQGHMSQVYLGKRNHHKGWRKH